MIRRTPASVRQWFPDVPFFAHRGLHSAGAGLVENSLPAFEAARDRGFGMECDVRLSADNIPFVFHDRLLDRMTASSGALRDRRADELDRIMLTGDGAIPRLSALLSLIAGRVPLLIELKLDRRERLSPLCVAVRKALDGYTGPAAVMSFHPGVARWFRLHAPQIARGYVVTEENDGGLRGRVKRGLAMRAAHPDFLAYDVRDLPSVFAARVRARGIPVLSWTVRSPDDWAKVQAHADAAIFEGEPGSGHGR